MDETKEQKRIYIEKPKKNPAVYLLYSNDEVVYVGQSKYPEKRIADHMSRMEHEEEFEFDSYIFMEYEEKDLNRLEAEMIYKHAPRFNKKIGAFKQLSGVYYVGRVRNDEELMNGRFSIPATLIGDSLYIDLTNTNIELKDKGENNRRGIENE